MIRTLIELVRHSVLPCGIHFSHTFLQVLLNDISSQMQFMFTNYLYNLCTYTRGEGADFLNLPTAQWKNIIFFFPSEFIRVILELTMQLHDTAQWADKLNRKLRATSIFYFSFTAIFFKKEIHKQSKLIFTIKLQARLISSTSRLVAPPKNSKIEH